jgi:nitrite reductase/ring-hydroxylating ferredoxin subunit/uncharacterized membrane protein
VSRPDAWAERLAGALETSPALGQAGGALRRRLDPAARPGRLRDALSGRGLGHPLHPLLVAGPLGAWGSALLCDLTGESDAARRLTGAGVVAAVPTMLSGASDWLDTAGAEQRVGVAHLAGNLVATSLYAASWVARRRGRPGLGRGLAGAGAVAASGAGWLGGHLSYGLGVGVDTNAFDGGPGDWTPVEGALPEGDGMQRVQVGGLPLAAVRQGGAVSALADRCSHRGGPLSDGELDGGCVTCPWHGSRFDARTGAVRRGPATVPQPVYEVRLAAGGAEARRDEQRALRTNTARVAPGS